MFGIPNHFEKIPAIVRDRLALTVTLGCIVCEAVVESRGFTEFAEEDVALSDGHVLRFTVVV
jgi:hypothetical protein